MAAAPGFKLDLKLQQGLVMTPELQLAIKLLQLPAQDLVQFVAQEIQDNPFLSDGTDGVEAGQAATPAETESAGTTEGAALDVDWDNFHDTNDGGRTAPSDATHSWEDFATTEKTLRDHLEEQVAAAFTSPRALFLARLLVDGINEAGYLTLALNTTATQLGVEEAALEEVLRVIHTFDPPGVGARDVAECLRLQLQQLNQLTPTAETILQNLPLLAAQDYAKLARLADVEPDYVLIVAQRIKQLTPKPGLPFGRGSGGVVVPDVMVERDATGQWQVELNAQTLPKVLLNKRFTGLRGADKAYATEKQNRANWLLKSLEQRAKTIYRTAKAIVELQPDFFNHGVEGLRPLTLKQVADYIGMHESTISRVTSGKFMQTPLGVFELKHFFSAAIQTTGGGVQVAAQSVKEMIKRVLGAEDPQKPLSDEAVVALLQNEGVDIARRTVAKYREELGILPTSKRRVRL